ncbi:hypothetical protein Dimus_026279 [Dionaea muscipula]
MLRAVNSTVVHLIAKKENPSMAHEGSLVRIRDQLMQFGRASGLLANPDKSSIYFGGVSSSRKVDLAAILGFKMISGVFLRLSASPRAFDREYLTNWIMKIARGKSKRASRLRVLFAAGVYCLWGERNSRIFQASAESPEAVIRRVLQSS